MQQRFGILFPHINDDARSKSHQTEYGLTISVQKTKSMAFKGRDAVRTKIVIDNKIIEKVNMFNYLENMISYKIAGCSVWV